MKIIDLLNKIANGEEVPEKIKFGDDIYYRKTDANEGYVIDYLDIRDNSLFNFITDYEYCFIKSCLEWEIKDLEEEKELPEKLKLYTLSDNDSADFTTLQDFNNRNIQRTINWILDYLKSKGDE